MCFASLHRQYKESDHLSQHLKAGTTPAIAPTSVLARRGWEYSDDDEEAVLIRVDSRSWQLGLNGEDSPRTIHFIDGTLNHPATDNNSSDDWHGAAFDKQGEGCVF